MRVVFHSSSAPEALLIHDKPTDQFVLDGCIFPIRHRDTPAAQRQASYARVSKLALDRSPRKAPLKITR